ncbi:hypothetical protein NGRA_0054 [Nosema granulosis]|uniref:Uncharacterized protein n=1 Tax=Nosema granulosis TaxID=83296 RepID=A0A9P6H1L1_9MICR|nr:hypothetical protein NGRA_0054 [Nosema granulosis]
MLSILTFILRIICTEELVQNDSYIFYLVSDNLIENVEIESSKNEYIIAFEQNRGGFITLEKSGPVDGTKIPVLYKITVIKTCESSGFSTTLSFVGENGDKAFYCILNTSDKDCVSFLKDYQDSTTEIQTQKINFIQNDGEVVSVAIVSNSDEKTKNLVDNLRYSNVRWYMDHFVTNIDTYEMEKKKFYVNNQTIRFPKDIYVGLKHVFNTSWTNIQYLKINMDAGLTHDNYVESEDNLDFKKKTNFSQNVLFNLSSVINTVKSDIKIGPHEEKELKKKVNVKNISDFFKKKDIFDYFEIENKRPKPKENLKKKEKQNNENDEKSTDEKSTDEKSTDEKSTDEKSTDEKSTDESKENDKSGEGVKFLKNTAEGQLLPVMSKEPEKQKEKNLFMNKYGIDLIFYFRFMIKEYFIRYLELNDLAFSNSYKCDKSIVNDLKSFDMDEIHVLKKIFSAISNQNITNDKLKTVLEMKDGLGFSKIISDLNIVKAYLYNILKNVRRFVNKHKDASDPQSLKLYNLGLTYFVLDLELDLMKCEECLKKWSQISNFYKKKNIQTVGELIDKVLLEDDVDTKEPVEDKEKDFEFSIVLLVIINLTFGFLGFCLIWAIFKFFYKSYRQRFRIN